MCYTPSYTNIMEVYLKVLLVSFLCACFHIITTTLTRQRSSSIPSGPYRFPIIRNILELGPNPHSLLANLSKNYGPLMSLKLGSFSTIMENYFIIFLAVSFFYACIHILTTKLACRKSFPPGPYAFPIIGNIFELGSNPHRSVAILSKKYGPLMSLKLGSITTIVVSSSKAAKEVLHKHYLASSSRMVSNSGCVLGHDKVSMVWLPVGKEWRNLRKVCKEQMFAQSKLEANQGLREKKAQELVDYIGKCSDAGEAVDIGRAAFTTTLNLLSNTLFSIDFANHDSRSSQEFRDIVSRIFDIVAKPNFADYFPILKWIDPQGIYRQSEIQVKKMFKVFDDIIEQRLKSRSISAVSSRSDDVLESFLDISEKSGNEFNYNVIKHLLFDLFLAGIDTTSNTLEFGMAELFRNPEKMVKAQAELKEVIGNDRLLREMDIPKLPYLQAVVKETLRLHPPAPFLAPHKMNDDIEVEGYVVPRNAQILVNIWAIARDSNMWPEPELFMPERILGNNKVDVQGQDFELIPFGSGRRICPGLPLAHRMVHLMLGSLLQCFDWKLEEGMRAEDVDINGKFGLVLHLAKPLKAIPIKI